MKEILIVEDNPMNMELILDLLEFYGHRVTEAEDGIKLLNALLRKSSILSFSICSFLKWTGLRFLTG